MSDSARKDLSTKAQETLTPDSQKSGLDKVKESTTDTADSIAGSMQPGDSKSTSQKLSDETSSTIKSAKDNLSSTGSKASGSTGSAQETGKTYLQSAQETVANVADSASKGLQNLANSISGSGSSASK